MLWERMRELEELQYLQSAGRAEMDIHEIVRAETQKLFDEICLDDIIEQENLADIIAEVLRDELRDAKLTLEI